MFKLPFKYKINGALIGLGSMVGYLICFKRYGYGLLTVTEKNKTNNNNNNKIMTENLILTNVHVIFRHGARTPLQHIIGLEEVEFDKNLLNPSHEIKVPCTIQNVNGGPRPNSDLESFFNKIIFKGGVVAGQLTTVGKEQCYQLGKRLADKYQSLISSNFQHSDYYFRSTNINRCIESVQCVLAGIQDFSNIKMDNVVIRVEPLEKPTIFPSPNSCPNFHNMSLRSQDILENKKDYVNLIKDIQEKTGQEFDVSKLDIMALRDNIVVRQTHGLSVPEYILEKYVEIDKIAVEVLLTIVSGVFHGNKTVGLSFALGQLIHNIAEEIKLSASGHHEKSPKLNMICGHDTTLAPFLSILGCFDNKWPYYANDICIELYEEKSDANKHWIRVTHCDKDLILRGCTESIIPLEKFLNVIKPFCLSTENYHNLCNNPNFSDHRMPDHTLSLEYITPPNVRN